MNDWQKFTDVNGDFQLANFLYRSINDLMKHSLDMGTLLCNDAAKLRAYKEQTKKLFKSKWLDIAQALEAFDIIEKCTCYSDSRDQFCNICKGSRYRLTSYLTSDEVREVGVFYNAALNADIANLIQRELFKAWDDLPEM